MFAIDALGGRDFRAGVVVTVIPLPRKNVTQFCTYACVFGKG